MIKNALLFCIALGVFTAASAQNAGKLILKKGDKYAVENKFTLLSSHEMMGQSIESKYDFNTSNNIEVTGSTDNQYNLTNTFTRITATISAMGQDMKFDSDKKEDMDGEMGKSMKDIINRPKDIIVDNQGKIISGKSDTATREAGAEMMSMVLNQFFGSQDKNGFGVSEAFTIIPAKAKAGFTWTDSSSAEGIKKSTTYTVKEIKGNEAVLNISGILDTDVKTEMQGMEIGTKTSGKLSGEEVVDLKTGIVKQRTTNLEASGNMQVMGQEMPVTTKLNAVSTIKPI